MAQLPLFEAPTWTVSDLTVYLRNYIEQNDALQDVWVLGEVSNLSRPASGHLYFTLKDASAALRCVMWRSSVRLQERLPADGDAAEVHGNLSIYEAGGQYQLYADQIRPAGAGLLYQRFLELKARLEAEGLFAPERKRPIPTWPRRIGVVTSPSGAAWRDILNTLQRRYPLAEVVLAPTPVQGAEAPAAIVAALRDLERLAGPDVILVARGGGSIEDLWAFNDEGVARAIVACAVPVITGVGHETDFTIADFASDLRAPTPTAAAELATPNKSDLLETLVEAQGTLGRAVTRQLGTRRSALSSLHTHLRLSSPAAHIRNARQRADELARRASLLCDHAVQLQRARLAGLQHRLAALNVQAILDRGFALVTKQDGSLVRQRSQALPGEEINIQVSDGTFEAQVKGKAKPAPGAP
ncbi:MAG: exodeoxyribonuclease VII large subunit [Anaerolineales bacterium]|nr:exodeoxyribonuclease VII large subunit [Anaerolineales bacterium]